jgi:hypothetical protein
VLLFLPLFGCGAKEAPAAATPPEVETTGIVEQDVPIYGEWIAILDGYVNAQIQPQITGYFMKQNYREGTFVPEVTCYSRSIIGLSTLHFNRRKGSLLKQMRNLAKPPSM